MANFRIDWEKKAATCPEGRQSIRWSETKTARGRQMIHIDFSPDDCAAYLSRQSCTQAKELPHTLTLYSQETNTRPSSLPENARRPKSFPPSTARGRHRRDSLARSKRAFGLRQARYRGLKKTHLCRSWPLRRPLTWDGAPTS